MPRRRAPATTPQLLQFVADASPGLLRMASRWQDGPLTARDRLAFRRLADRADALLARPLPAEARDLTFVRHVWVAALPPRTGGRASSGRTIGMSTPIADGREAALLRLWREMPEGKRRAVMASVDAFNDGESFEDAMTLLLTEQGWPAVAARAKVCEVMAHPSGTWREQLD